MLNTRPIPPKPVIVTIDRRLWIRGDHFNELSALYRESVNGHCCLGFGCIKAGLNKWEILNMAAPSSVRRLIKGTFMEALLESDADDSLNDSAVANALMRVNDSLIGQQAYIAARDAYVYKDAGIKLSEKDTGYFILKSETHRERALNRICRSSRIGFEFKFVN